MGICPIVHHGESTSDNMHRRLYKSHGVLWLPVQGLEGWFIADNPLCPNETCHVELKSKPEGYYCWKCDKLYPRQRDAHTTVHEVRESWEGASTLDYDVYSLDLPPTKVSTEAEDDHYWVYARLGEKNGKRTAVVYVGEKIHGKQDKKDYTQLFLDVEDEQLRFDKNNKNPMKLLTKLTAEFPESTTEIKPRKHD